MAIALGKVYRSTEESLGRQVLFGEGYTKYVAEPRAKDDRADRKTLGV